MGLLTWRWHPGLLIDKYFLLKVIKGSSVSPGVKTFGYSLSGKLDLDDNGYPGETLL